MIVEIGSIRCAGGRKTDGYSTLAWAESGLDTWSVDVSLRATMLWTAWGQSTDRD